MKMKIQKVSEPKGETFMPMESDSGSDYKRGPKIIARQDRIPSGHSLIFSLEFWEWDIFLYSLIYSTSMSPLPRLLCY